MLAALAIMACDETAGVYLRFYGWYSGCRPGRRGHRRDAVAALACAAGICGESMGWRELGGLCRRIGRIVCLPVAARRKKPRHPPLRGRGADRQVQSPRPWGAAAHSRPQRRSRLPPWAAHTGPCPQYGRLGTRHSGHGRGVMAGARSGRSWARIASQAWPFPCRAFAGVLVAALGTPGDFFPAFAPVFSGTEALGPVLPWTVGASAGRVRSLAEVCPLTAALVGGGGDADGVWGLAAAGPPSGCSAKTGSVTPTANSSPYSAALEPFGGIDRINGRSCSGHVHRVVKPLDSSLPKAPWHFPDGKGANWKVSPLAGVDCPGWAGDAAQWRRWGRSRACGLEAGGARTPCVHQSEVGTGAGEVQGASRARDGDYRWRGVAAVEVASRPKLHSAPQRRMPQDVFFKILIGETAGRQRPPVPPLPKTPHARLLHTVAWFSLAPQSSSLERVSLAT
jgi:hypothetical protein